MACRKAAYRAMTEVSEWTQKQQEKAAVALAALEKEQRKIWTPTALFETCCTKWLAEGAEVLGARQSNHSAIRGCSGGCGREHPRITLDFQHGQATALLSHELDPFVLYFDGLCDKGLAGKITPTEYQLTGFLQFHLEKLQETTNNFGSHLVKVSPTALAASKRAHERQTEQEELEQEAKRRKMQGPATNHDFLESVLEVCWEQQYLQDHLDLAEIAWMRVSCKRMAKFAARMASSRLRQVRLSCSVLVDGVFRIQENNNNNDRRESRSDDEGCIVISQEDGTNRYCVEQYNVVVSHLPLASSSTDDIGRFVPQETTQLEWGSGVGMLDDDDYRGHLIRVYLEGSQTSSLPEKDCLFSSSGPLEVARYRIDPREGLLHEGAVHKSSNLTYKVTSAVREETSIPTTMVQYKGSFTIKAIQFDFHDLLGIYVRKKLPIEKQKMQETKRKRPVSRAEKEYVRALARAAREAPGSSQAFEGMIGW